jgi:predicted RNase H-like nuclease (RuvC/YqgF family)
MKKGVSAVLSLVLIALFVAALVGCGQEIKAENEKLKAENASLKSDNDKIKGEVQKLKDEVQKAVEKDATITSLTAEKEALMKQVEDQKAQMANAKPATKAPAKKKK